MDFEGKDYFFAIRDEFKEDFPLPIYLCCGESFDVTTYSKQELGDFEDSHLQPSICI